MDEPVTSTLFRLLYINDMATLEDRLSLLEYEAQTLIRRLKRLQALPAPSRGLSSADAGWKPLLDILPVPTSFTCTIKWSSNESASFDVYGSCRGRSNGPLLIALDLDAIMQLDASPDWPSLLEEKFDLSLVAELPGFVDRTKVFECSDSEGVDTMFTGGNTNTAKVEDGIFTFSLTGVQVNKVAFPEATSEVPIRLVMAVAV
jgi:hypothetical protein